MEKGNGIRRTDAWHWGTAACRSLICGPAELNRWLAAAERLRLQSSTTDTPPQLSPRLWFPLSHCFWLGHNEISQKLGEPRFGVRRRHLPSAHDDDLHHLLTVRPFT